MHPEHVPGQEALKEEGYMALEPLSIQTSIYHDTRYNHRPFSDQRILCCGGRQMGNQFQEEDMKICRAYHLQLAPYTSTAEPAAERSCAGMASGTSCHAWPL